MILPNFIKIDMLTAASVLLSATLSMAAVAQDVGDEQPQPVMAILDLRFDGVTFAPDVTERMNQYLSSRVAGAGLYLVVPRDQVARALVEQKVKEQEPCRGSCSVALGGSVGASKVMHGSMMRVAGACSLILDVYDLQTETMEKSVEVPDLACSEAGLRQGIQDGARMISEASGNARAPVVTDGVGSVTPGVSIDRGDNVVNDINDESGLLFVQTEPAKANISINGRPVGRAPYQALLKPGRYVISASLNSEYHDVASEVVLTSTGATVSLTLPPAFGSLDLTSQPADAEILLDGRPVGRTPYVDNRIKSGEYQIEVRKDLYVSDFTKIKINDGQSVKYAAKLKVDFGSLDVTTEPSGAAVNIDGKATGLSTPASFPQMAKGLHVVTLDLAGYGRRVENVVVDPGKSARISVPMDAKFGMLTVMSEDADGSPCVGALSIDGRVVGKTPWKDKLLAVSHTVMVDCGNGFGQETIEVKHNDSVTLKMKADRGTQAWQEDFSTYAESAYAENWGRTLLVKKGPDGRKYLTSEHLGTWKARQSVRMGTNFVFEFDWTNYDHREIGTHAPWVRVPIIFKDRDGRLLEIECGNWGLIVGKLDVVDFDESDINRFRMERRGDIFAFYNNGTLLKRVKINGISDIIEFSIEVPVTMRNGSMVGTDAQMFTRFRVEPL